MAHLIRPLIVRYIDPKTRRRVPKGTPGARRVKERAAKYYAKGVPGWPKGKKVPLATDKRASQRMLDDLVTAAERGQAGVADRFQEHRAKPIAEHLDAYGKALLAKGDTERYVKIAVCQIQALCAGCGFRFPGDIESGRVTDWLTELRKDREPPALPLGRDSYSPGEVAALLGVTRQAVLKQARVHGLRAAGNGKARRYPRADVERFLALSCRGASVQTANYYLTALKGFCRWLVRERRIPDSPVAHLQGGNPKLDRRHDRRDLSVEELVAVLEAARNSTTVYRGLTAADRYHLYVAACGTGFRADELAALMPESFALDTEPPTARLPTSATKNRKGAVQPLPPGVAATLRDYLRGRPAGQRLWPGTWHERGADMLRIDLEAAGVPYEVQGPDGPLYADFHALRHTYVSMLARSGLTVKQAQVLARHSTAELTIARYAHAALPELGAAVGKLPSLAAGESAGAVEMVTVPAAEYDALTTMAGAWLALIGALSRTLVVPRVVPGSATAGDVQGRPGTDGRMPGRKAG